MSTSKGLGEELSKLSLDLASRENATYADFRLVNSRDEVVTVVNDNSSSEETQSMGVGIRVLYGGTGWGFAETDETDPDSIRETTLKAFSLARGASKIGSKVSFADEPVHVDNWESPVKKDPFNIQSDEKYRLLQESTGRMKEENIVVRRGQMAFSIVEKYFASSTGSRIHQKFTYSGAAITVAAKGPAGIQ